MTGLIPASLVLGLEMFRMFSDAGVEGLVTTEEILEGKKDQALTPLHPRIDYVHLVDFAVRV